MQTEVKESGRFERVLTLQIEEAELEPAKDAVARKLSQQLKIKGFRPGRAPRQIVESMVGPETFRGEVIEEALPKIIGSALTEAELAPVTAPRIQDIRDIAAGVEVDVLVTLWPRLDRPPVVEGRKIEVETPDVTDEEIGEQVERLRDQFAELEEVDRPGDNGDFAMVNITVSQGGREVEEASASDLLYEIGSGSFIPGLDEILAGASLGDIRETETTLPAGFGEHEGEPASMRVLVKGIRAKRLPDLSDEWVSDVTEFETVGELNEQLRDNLGRMKRSAAGAAFRERLVAALVEELDLDLPEPLVEAEMEASLHSLVHRLEPQGVDIANYLRITGQSEDQFAEELRKRATAALRTRILLETVARADGIDVADEEYERAVEEIADSSGRPADEIMKELARTGQDQALTGDILRRKALDRLTEQATPVDAEGNPVDLGPPDIDLLEVDDEVEEAGTDDEPEQEHESSGSRPAEAEE